MSNLSRTTRLSLFAAELRQAPTHSEQLLWSRLRACQLGVRFRRQVPVAGKYVVDFLAPSLRLIVEVDGGYHKQRRAADARRDRWLQHRGYRVLRLPAEVVERNVEGAVGRVRAAVGGAG